MYHAGLILAKAQQKDGTYSVQQLENSHCPPISSFVHQKNRHYIQATIQPFQISGWVDALTFEMTISVSIWGIDLGTFDGVANQGLQVNLELALLIGSVRLEVNAFNEIWVHVDTVPSGKVHDGACFCDLECKKSVHIQDLPGDLACAPWV